MMKLPVSKRRHRATLTAPVRLLVLAASLSACSSLPPSNVKSNAQLTPTSRVTQDLAGLPKPKRKIAVAVYGFRDQTGQYKPSPDSSYSTSVTQGAAAMLVKALKDSGWYAPVEREALQNLLTERKIVRALESPTDKGKPLINLPQLLPASLIIEGGVIAYESNVRTGGKGANYLGVGASTQYRVDQVTVSLRVVDIRNGQVLDTVSVTKTIYSYQFSASVYKFTSYQSLLQGETGYTTNEPAQLAVREAIEAAVVHLTALGIRDRYLELRNPQDFFTPVLQSYLKENLLERPDRDDDSESEAPVLMNYLNNEGGAAVPLVGELNMEGALTTSRAVPARPASSQPAVPAPAPETSPAPIPAPANLQAPAPAPAPVAPPPVKPVAAAIAAPLVTTPAAAKPTAPHPAVAAPAVALKPTATPVVNQPVAAQPTAVKPVTASVVAEPASVIKGPTKRTIPPTLLPSDNIFRQYWKTQDAAADGAKQ